MQQNLAQPAQHAVSDRLRMAVRARRALGAGIMRGGRSRVAAVAGAVAAAAGRCRRGRRR